jgi:hypothetical protein
MKLRDSRIAWAFLLSVVCVACAAPASQEKGAMPVVIAAERSVAYANRDRVNRSEYMVKLAALSANGYTRAIHREGADSYQASILRKLENKRYWEICYGASEPGMVGATYCYYLDSVSYELLADYQVK